MKKYISVNKETVAKLRKAFGKGQLLCERSVRDALSYRSNSDLSSRIRKAARENGGVTYTVIPEGECFYDSDGSMHVVYPNDAELYLDKITGEGKVYHHGKVVSRYTSVRLTDIPEMQSLAKSL